MKTGSIRDVICASVGAWTSSNSEWGGLYVRDPLSTPKSAATIFVDGLESLSVASKPQKTYRTVGDSEIIPADFDIWDSEKPSDDIVNVDLEKVDEHVSYCDNLDYNSKTYDGKVVTWISSSVCIIFSKML